MTSYFELGFGAYLTNLSVGMLFFLLIVKLFDIVFNKKFSPGWRYGIAVAVSAFLLIPLRVSGPWSIIPIVSLNVPLFITSPEPILLEGITEVKGYSTGAEAQGQFLYEPLFYIWITGAIAAFLYQMIRLAGFYRAVGKKSIPCENSVYNSIITGICREMKVKKPGLLIYPETDTPFAMGIISPKIILPSGDFSQKEAEYIFRHEVCHIKRRDILMKLFLIIFRCINWFNPLAHILVKNAFSDMEIACDERVSKNFSRKEREEYSKTLLKGASKVKYPAVTTYLSPSARVVKKRIDAVMNIRKFGKAVPFSVAFAVIFLLSQTYYAMPDDREYAMYIYTDPYPMEADPYITSSEWRTAQGETLAEAGEKIFRQYMEMYMGGDVPDYYRIEDYYIEGVYAYDDSDSYDDMTLTARGIFSPHDYVSFAYSFVTANKCGNTVHNKNFGSDPHLNGVYNNCEMAFELEKNGNSCTVVNIGTAGMFGFTDYHFTNSLTNGGTIDKAASMAKAGLLDYNWNDTDNLPDPDDICEYAYRNKQLSDELFRRRDPGRKTDSELSVPFRMSFGTAMSVDEAYIKTAGCIKKNAGGYDVIDPEKLRLDENKGFEYCGYDAVLESKAAVIYGNVTGENPHGVKLYLYISDNEENTSYIYRRLHKVEITDQLFTPAEFHDSFDNIPLPENMTSAEDILEYMKTPRDGCDFTVMDYHSITEEADGTYAQVRFKGRLDGQYSADITEYSDGYLKTKII